MIGKILLATKGKPCICPAGKICTVCKNKKGLKPRVVIEECSPLPIPIKITTYQEKPTTVQLLQKPRLWNFRRKPAPIECKKVNRGTKFCQWYRRRKALKQLTKLTKLEQKRLAALRIEKAHHEREAEFLEQLKKRQKATRFAEHDYVTERPSKQELKRREAIENARREREIAEYKEQKRRETIEEARREREIAEFKERKRREAIEEARREREIAQFKERKRREAIEEARREKELAEFKERKRREAIEDARLEREIAEYKEQFKQRQKESRFVEPKLVTDPPTKQELKKLEAARIENARREREAAELKKKRKQKKKHYVDSKLFTQPSDHGGIKYKKKPKKIKKKKATEAKPTAESRYVTVKTLKPHSKEPFSERFVNFCYRLCCQFYCCLSILLLITCIIIFVI